MFPGYTGGQAVGVTFDAAGGKVVKLFSGMGQVKAIVTPQNISDSASTSLDPFADFKMFGHKRTEFLFPDNNEENNQWNCQSTLFSKDWCTINFVNVNYNTNSPNGFKIQIQWPVEDPKDEFIIDYDALGFQNVSGAGASQGPSAPYLAGLINTIAAASGSDELIQRLQTDTSLKPDQDSVIPLQPLIIYLLNSSTLSNEAQRLEVGVDELIIRLLFDLKRAGDYEQAKTALWAKNNDPSLKVILSTGDVLCSTYARTIKQPCILRGIGGGGEHGSAIALFRFPENKEEIKYSQAYNTMIDIIDMADTILSVWDTKDGAVIQAYETLVNALDNFASSPTTGLYIAKFDGEELLSDDANMIFGTRIENSGVNFDTNYANTLFTQLLRCKFKELYNTIQESSSESDSTLPADRFTSQPQGELDIVNNTCQILVKYRQQILKKMRVWNDEMNKKEQEGDPENVFLMALSQLLVEESAAANISNPMGDNQENVGYFERSLF
jgi:hypothetical protein